MNERFKLKRFMLTWYDTPQEALEHAMDFSELEDDSNVLMLLQLSETGPYTTIETTPPPRSKDDVLGIVYKHYKQGYRVTFSKVSEGVYQFLQERAIEQQTVS